MGCRSLATRQIVIARALHAVALLLVCAVLPLGASGCAPGIASWIVKERNQQGDVALRRGNYPDASVAYQLALKLDPANVHARTGLTAVQVRLAQTLFAASRFDDAIDALSVANRSTPGDDRVTTLHTEIVQAQIKRDIVVSNYPSYKVTGAALRRSYTQLKTQNQAVLAALKRFDYTYDTTDLSTAIKQSYALNEEVARLTNRLQQYRQLVESGVPEHGAENLAPPASLLPLP
ncbi:MAG: tetratricopeptide repeat protein [Candidatus Eremiobacteraeota bacterium]|nr:tetratricopeptide repeat protein [Candidatus Eremiobacteraeota bacterium]